jgi:hypothetical protein
MRRALIALALLAPIAAHAQPAPQGQGQPSQAATLAGSLATNWSTSLIEVDALRARVAELERQLAVATAPKPAPATEAPKP